MGGAVREGRSFFLFWWGGVGFSFRLVLREATRSIEERFLDCASRQLRRSEVEKQKRRLASLGMTGFWWGGKAKKKAAVRRSGACPTLAKKNATVGISGFAFEIDLGGEETKRNAASWRCGARPTLAQTARVGHPVLSGDRKSKTKRLTMRWRLTRRRWRRRWPGKRWRGVGGLRRRRHGS